MEERNKFPPVKKHKSYKKFTAFNAFNAKRCGRFVVKNVFFSPLFTANFTLFFLPNLDLGAEIGGSYFLCIVEATLADCFSLWKSNAFHYYEFYFSATTSLFFTGFFDNFWVQPSQFFTNFF